MNKPESETAEARCLCSACGGKCLSLYRVCSALLCAKCIRSVTNG